MDRIIDNVALGRFELAFDGGVAFADYRADGERVIITHTEVPPAYSGQGIGSRLAKGIFDELRSSGRKAVIRCSFIADCVRRHPDYRDLVAG